MTEFQKGLQDPASIAFGLADENSDGKLTEKEAGNALTQMVTHIGLRTHNSKGSKTGS